MNTHSPNIRFVAILCILFSALVVKCVNRSVAAEPNWKVGLAAVCITPDQPLRLAGYASRKKPSQGVASDLFAKALAIEDADGHRGVILTTDLIGLRTTLVDPLSEKISEKTGLSRQQVLVNSSHVHTGPALSLDADELDYPQEQSAATVRYTRKLLDQLADLVAESLRNLQPANLSRGVGVAEFVMNRREFTDRGVILGFNPRGHTDRSVPVLRIEDQQGELRAVLFGAACHNTTLTHNDYLISGDFSGYAQIEIERLRPAVQAMFMQGCGGDANPHPRGNEALARKHGSTLAQEVMRVLDGKLAPVQGTLRIAQRDVKLPLASRLTRQEIEKIGTGGGWRSFVAEKMIAALDRDGKLPEHYSTPIAVWQFGTDLTLVALSGEVVVDYVSLLERALGPQRLWIAAYCNDVYGYLPSARILAEGGYETRGLYYGSVGLFSAEAETILVDHVRELVSEVRSVTD